MIARTFIAITFSLWAYGQIFAQIQPLVDLTNKDYEKAMQSTGDGFLDRFDNMPRVPFRLKDDPRYYNKYGEEHALAFYTRDENNKPVIYVNPKHSNRATYIEIVNTVLHELTHAWVDWKKIGNKNISHGHDEAFIKKAIELGLNINSTLDAFPDSRKIYDRLTRGTNVGNSSNDGSKQGKTFIGKCDPVKEVGCFGMGVYNYQFFDQTENPNEIQFIESRLFRVDKPDAVGTYVPWKNSTWRVHSISGSTVWLIREKANCNPIKDAGCFGEKTYNYQFVSNASDSEKIRFIENILVKGVETPKVGMVITWRNLRWRCYLVAGSMAWFTEADKVEEFKPTAWLGAVQEDDDEYYYSVPANAQWYGVVIPNFSYPTPQLSFYNIRLDVKKESVLILTDGKIITLDSDEYWDFSVNSKKGFYVKSSVIQNKPIKLRLKVRY